MIGALLVLGASPASAQSGCAVTFNGVEAERVDSLNSPLELDTTDVLIFTGTDPGGTGSAAVKLFIGPIAIETGTTTYGTPEQEFTATINLDDISPYGVGLFRAEGTTDGCTAGAWVRVSGRFPFATLTGLTAVGLAVGGATGQLGAIASRRRWARSAAALGGIATGTGLALVGQQFGRLQISYVSIAIIAIGVGFLGWLLASFFNPVLRERRRESRSRPVAARTESTAAPAKTSPVVKPEPQTPAQVEGDGPASEPAPEPQPVAEPEPEPATRAAEPAPPPPTGPFWCYVLAPTDVFDLTDHTRRVAVLQPGSWYLAKRIVGGWAHVVAEDGAEGWVAEGSIQRQD